MLTEAFPILIILIFVKTCNSSCKGCYKSRKYQPAPESKDLSSPYLEECSQDSQGIIKQMKYDTLPSLPLKEGVGFLASSACLRCAACIVIAEKLNETLEVAHATAHWLRRLDEDYVVELLRSLCINGFERYGLYEVYGKKIISEPMSCASYVPSELDGLWTKKLREACHFYLDEYGEVNVYNNWLHDGLYPAHDMINKLCRSDRIFRDCININDMEMNLFTSDEKTIRMTMCS